MKWHLGSNYIHFFLVINYIFLKPNLHYYVFTIFSNILKVWKPSYLSQIHINPCPSFSSIIVHFPKKATLDIFRVSYSIFFIFSVNFQLQQLKSIQRLSLEAFEILGKKYIPYSLEQLYFFRKNKL